MKTVDLGGCRGPLQILNTPTTVDCTKNIRFRRSFRSIVGCVVSPLSSQYKSFAPSPTLSLSKPHHNPMKTVDMGGCRGPLQILNTPTTVDWTKDIRFRRSFRSIVECVVPCCGGFQTTEDNIQTSNVTATFFGYQRRRVSFCLHDPSQTSPLLLLDFDIPTSYLARAMRHGLLRIALKSPSRASSGTIFHVPVWTMYCNGRKVGFAVRRKLTEADSGIFKQMQSVSVGVGVLPGEMKAGEGDLMYLRARLERVTGSVDSESFHMINPAGSIGEELSILLLRS